MTNKQTIDGVSRDAILWLLKHNPVLCQKSGLDTPELRALLDNPESLEPVAPWFYFVECDDPDYSGLFNHESEAQTQANDHGGDVVKLWNVPPTWKPAAHPQGEVERLRGLLKAYMNAEAEKGVELVKLRAQLAERDALLREIANKCNVGFAMRERLLSALSTSAEPKPRGEPVAVMYSDGSVLTKAECGDSFEVCCKVETPLYAEQPAPVAQSTSSDQYKAELYDEVWQKARDMGFANVTDALEEVAKLNGIKP